MTEIDALPTDQHALIELVLRRGRSYRELANLLSVDLTAIRQRATAATAALGPRDVETPAQHEALTDYLLGQLPEALNLQAQGLLETSKPANEWAKVVAEKLERFAPGRVGTVPELSAKPAGAPAAAPGSSASPQSAARPTDEGATRLAASPVAAAGTASERTATASTAGDVATAAASPSQPPRAPTSDSSTSTPTPRFPAPTQRASTPAPTPQPARKTEPYIPKHLAPTGSATALSDRSKRRRLVFAAAAIAIIILAIVLVLALSGSGTKHQTSLAGGDITGTGASTATSGTTTTSTTATTATQQTTTQQSTTSGSKIESTVAMTSPAGYKSTVGVAQVVRGDGTLKLVLSAEGVPSNSASNAYAVWLYSNPAKKLLLGFVTESVSGHGNLKIDGALPANARRYQRVLLTLETDPHPTQPGTIVLSGTLYPLDTTP